MPTKCSQLVLFTSEFPYGKGEAYLESEIKYLSEEYSQISIISNAEQLSEIRSIPVNVRVFNRPYGLTFIQKNFSLAMLIKLDFWQELLFVFYRYKIRLNITVINTILQSIYKSYQLQKFLKHNLNITQSSTESLLYSYWADDNAVSLALMKCRGFSFNAICRAHRWDVYFEKNGSGYLPFRKILADKLSAIYFVSRNGLEYFANKIGYLSKNSHISRLGVYVLNGCQYHNGQYDLVLLSCSFVIDRKRVHKIAEALSHVNNKIRIKWTHIGSGPGMDSLRRMCENISRQNTNLHIELLGAIPNKEVKEFYCNNYVDLFINVSESEGVPVSIMEAMSAGVPCMATDVDGVSEIVHDEINGFLLPLSEDERVISKKLENYFSLSANKKMALRKGAFKTWHEDYNAEKNYRTFIHSLSNLSFKEA